MQLKDDLKEEITELEQRLTQPTNKILQELETLKEENRNLRNRSMRSTLIFRGTPESEQSDVWEDVSKNLVNRLCDMQTRSSPLRVQSAINTAHRSPKSDFDKGCRPIYAQFVNWRYADNLQRRLIALQASKKSKLTVSPNVFQTVGTMVCLGENNFEGII